MSYPSSSYRNPLVEKERAGARVTREARFLNARVHEGRNWNSLDSHFLQRAHQSGVI